ncbi:hypothetical protein GRF29_44g941911 [Pseudopithomyces chartarum]|uniref:Uncharacterized protein n=1 Tax=Pseudopithomyces chartarum TaxID=1892770 RepID=A0AAN6M052_9PLEO|nr:hypothetical protein GRF29_44g941911 [Pseudopithomyces chartarum]
MQLKATLFIIATMALSVLANPVPGTTALEQPESDLLSKRICYCLCDPCKGNCKLCDSGTK